MYKLKRTKTMKNKTTNSNNLTIVRNVAYSQIKKMKKNIKELVEVDNDLLNIIDINMKNAINKTKNHATQSSPYFFFGLFIF